MRRTPRKEMALPMFTHAWLLLANHEEGYDRFCEDMSHLPISSRLDPHSPNQPPKYDNAMAIPHLGARSNWPYWSGFRRPYLDSCSHRVFYHVGGSNLALKGHWCCCGKFYTRAYHHSLWYPLQAH